MTKIAYKQLKKKLRDKFIIPYGHYEVQKSMVDWQMQCGVDVDADTILIPTKIFGSIFYPYQQDHRLIILNYLSTHSYKEFKREFIANK